MKKILSLFSLLMLFVIGAQADEKTITWKADAETKVDAETALVDESDLKVETVYGTTLKEDKQTIAKEEFTHYIQVRTAGYPTQAVPTGAEQSGNTPLIFTPKKDMKVTLYYRRQSTSVVDSKGVYADSDKKDLVFISQNDLSKRITNRVVKGELAIDNETTDGKYGYSTKTVLLPANDTYTLCANGTTIQLYGISVVYDYIDPNVAEVRVFNDLFWANPTAAPEAGATFIDNEFMTANTVFATTYNSNYECSKYEYPMTGSITVRVNADPSKNTLTGTQNNVNTPLVITAKEDFTAVFYYRRQSWEATLADGETKEKIYFDSDGKDLQVYDQGDLTLDATAAYSVVKGKLTVVDGDGNYAYVYKAVNLTKGETYTVCARGTTIQLLGIGRTYDETHNISDGKFENYTSLDFNSCKDGAVSRGGRHVGDLTTENAAKEGIALPFVINAADATLTIAPNEDATNYPEGSEPCSKFIETVAGPQLLISGGYSGATLTLDKTTTDFNEIKLNLTNWSKKMTAKATNAGADVEGIFDPATGVWKSKNAGETADKIVFTVQADTTWVCESKFKPKDPKKPDGDQVYDGYKLIEVVNHDMGIVKINSIEINPVYDVIVDAADGTELSAAVAAATAAIKNPKSLIINLAAGGNYTVTNSITTAVPTTINGNGATIDASENSNNFLQMATISAPTEWVAADITIKDVTIKGLQKALFYSNSKNYIAENFIIDNCVVEQAADAITIDYTKGSTANITVTNSTFYAPTKTTKSFYSSQSAQKYTEYDASGVQTFKFHNNTMYNLAPTKNFFTHRQNSQKWLAYDVQNNIFVDCGKSGQVIKGFNGGGSSANPIWTVKGNVFNYGGADTSASESTGDADEPVEESIAGVVTFADAENGDFTQTLTTTAGDPRWIGGGSGAITGIEAVKEAKTAEDGAWYTIQGQRVAQPTKGLYIHNGKKVVIK